MRTRAADCRHQGSQRDCSAVTRRGGPPRGLAAHLPQGSTSGQGASRSGGQATQAVPRAVRALWMEIEPTAGERPRPKGHLWFVASLGRGLADRALVRSSTAAATQSASTPVSPSSDGIARVAWPGPPNLPLPFHVERSGRWGAIPRPAAGSGAALVQWPSGRCVRQPEAGATSSLNELVEAAPRPRTLVVCACVPVGGPPSSPTRLEPRASPSAELAEPGCLGPVGLAAGPSNPSSRGSRLDSALRVWAPGRRSPARLGGRGRGGADRHRDRQEAARRRWALRTSAAIRPQDARRERRLRAGEEQVDAGVGAAPFAASGVTLAPVVGRLLLPWRDLGGHERGRLYPRHALQGRDRG